MDIVKIIINILDVHRVLVCVFIVHQSQILLIVIIYLGSIISILQARFRAQISVFFIENRFKSRLYTAFVGGFTIIASGRRMRFLVLLDLNIQIRLIRLVSS